MSDLNLIESIKSHAYWRVEIRPTEYKEDRIKDRSTMEGLISSSMVSFRGWPYPYYRKEETEYNGQFLSGKVDWGGYKEYWRLYKSGQWLNYLALPYANKLREELFKYRSPLPPAHKGYILVLGDVLFQLTEILRFSVNLGERGILGPKAYIEIKLFNVNDHMLYSEQSRAFDDGYVCTTNDPISQKLEVPTEQLRAIADEKALEMAKEIFSIFNWTLNEASLRILGDDQQKLVERRR